MREIQGEKHLSRLGRILQTRIKGNVLRKKAKRIEKSRRRKGESTPKKGRIICSGVTRCNNDRGSDRSFVSFFLTTPESFVGMNQRDLRRTRELEGREKERRTSKGGMRKLGGNFHRNEELCRSNGGERPPGTAKHLGKARRLAKKKKVGKTMLMGRKK